MESEDKVKVLPNKVVPCKGNARRLCPDEDCIDCLDRSFASHEKAIYWHPDNKVNPREVFKSSGSKFKFICNVCKHAFESALDNINGGKRCPYCSNSKLCSDKDCIDCLDKSFAGHERSVCWHPDNKLKPRDVFKNCNSKFKFICNMCNHTFESQLSSINSGRWCSYCSDPPKQLCSNKDCADCFNKSFASHEKSAYWHPDNKVSPRSVFKSSGSKYKFICNTCKHAFESAMGDISRGAWCPYCSAKQLCSDEDCINCLDKSFASHEKAVYWHPDNKLKPRDVFKSGHTKFKFICNVCNHTFESTLNGVNRGSWCPKCTNKTELKLHNWLLEQHPGSQTQFRAEWCRNPESGKHLPFDFVLPEYNVIIELDGIQHFKQTSNWAAPEETQKRDKYKMECANKQGYTVIRLLQEDVFEDRIDWALYLKTHIKKYDAPTVVYPTHTDLYDDHK